MRSTGILSPLIGRILCDRYRVDSVIRAGGMGAVCRAYDIRLERDVAVKVIMAVPQDQREMQRLQARFLREARAAARIQHPNVVAIYDFGTDPALDLDFFVMELLEGEDLDARIKRAGGVIPIDEVREILRCAAAGLAAGHRIGLTHRDVKPSNIFLMSEKSGSKVKLLDFGIVQLDQSDGKTLTQLTVHGGSPLTPRYASPEQIQGRHTVSPASDVFSLALTGLEMVAGVPLAGLNSNTDPRVHRGAVEHILNLHPDLPPCLGAILRRGLSIAPDDRFVDANEFLAALTECGDRVSGGTNLSTGPERGARAMPRKSALRQAFVWLLAGVALAVSLWKLAQQVPPPADDPTPPSEYQLLASAEGERVVSRFGARAGDTLWVIVLASFDSTKLERARAFRERVEVAGFEAGLATSPVYREVRNGLVAVIAGPYSRPVTEGELASVRSRVATDAFVKRVTLSIPAGPASTVP